jgi:hypothetical protein
VGAGGAISTGEDEFRATLIRLYCDKFVACCSSGGFVFDHAQCQTSFLGLVGGTLMSARAGYYTYDPAAGARCLDTLAVPTDPSCDSFPASLVCDGVFQGSLKPGDPCNAAVECAHGPGDSFSCEVGPDGNSVCIVKRRATEGQACEQSCKQSGGVTTCYGSTSSVAPGRCFQNDGLFCSGGVCTKLTAVGGLCGDELACTGDATCDYSVGICVPRGGPAASCTTASYCHEDLHCAMGQCSDDYPVGGACTASNQCGAGSCRNGACSPLSVGIAALCSVLESGAPFPGP